MSNAAEVVVKLVVDSNAPKATADLKRGLDKANKEATKFFKVTSGFKTAEIDVSKLAIGLGAGLVTAAVAGGTAVLGLASAAAYAFLESEKQVRALAGTLTLLDKSGTGFEKMTDISRGLKDELEETAMQVGATDDELMAAFTDVIERGGKSIEQAQALTEEMANAGRAVPGGIGTLSGAFEQIEMGAVRAKNPIVGMIAATHMLKGNAKQVAKQMQAMTPEKQMELAEKAIAAMGKKMKEVPLSIGEMSTSMKVFVGNLFEDAGQPIIGAIVPVFSMVRGWLMDNQGLLKGVAKAFGGAMGKVVEVALPIASEVFSVIKASSGDIKSAFEALYGPGKELFGYIYENRGVFAKTIGDVVKLIIQATAALVKGMAAVRDGIFDALSALATTKIPWLAGKGMFGSGIAEMVAGGQLKKGRDAVSGAGFSKAGRAAIIADQRAAYIASMDAAGKVQGAAETYDRSIQAASINHTKIMDAVAAQRAAAEGGNAEALAAAYDLAAGKQDDAATESAAKFLVNSEALRKALIEKGPEVIKSGFDGLITKLTAMGAGAQAEELTKGMAAKAKAAVPIGKSLQVKQYIGTVNIKQDFKDVDPDRIAVVFRNDLAKHGVARIMPNQRGI